MTAGELEKEVNKLRTITEAKIIFLRDHLNIVQGAMRELSNVYDEELDLVQAKIKELEERIDKYGLN